MAKVIVEWREWCIALPQLDSEREAIGFELAGCTAKLH
jgi:hypothetical protein